MGIIHIDSTLNNKLKQKQSIHKSSSSVFFVVNNPTENIYTEISLLNHFLIKRGISDVIANVAVHNLNGLLEDVFSIELKDKRTYTINPCQSINKKFVGSVYISFHSNENLAIPFCAVVGSIKTNNSICSVHTYGRRLEQKELGTNIDLNRTKETGWTLRDSHDIKSFGVFHNGQFTSELNLNIECTNYKGNLIEKTFKNNVLPFETLLITPQEIIPSLENHLDGKLGHAKISINGIKGVFPRMMCGNFAIDNKNNNKIITAKEIQFTHTNFDFSEIYQSDSMGNKGYFNHPSLPKGYGLFYPVTTKKTISINSQPYTSGSLHKFNIIPFSQGEIISKNDTLPSRFIGASVGQWEDTKVESECSTGIFTEDYLKVPSHWKWGLLKPGFENGEAIITIMLNSFSRNEDLSRKLNLRFFSEEGLNIEKEIILKANLMIDAMDFLPRKLPRESIWYVITGNNLEDLNIFSTFYPQKKSGYTEHSF